LLPSVGDIYAWLMILLIYLSIYNSLVVLTRIKLTENFELGRIIYRVLYFSALLP